MLVGGRFLMTETSSGGSSKKLAQSVCVIMQTDAVEEAGGRKPNGSWSEVRHNGHSGAGRLGSCINGMLADGWVGEDMSSVCVKDDGTWGGSCLGDGGVVCDRSVVLRVGCKRQGGEEAGRFVVVDGGWAG